MKKLRRTAPTDLRTTAFFIYFLAILAMVFVPAIYLQVSGNIRVLFGVPLPFLYWIAPGVLSALGVGGLYLTDVALNSSGHGGSV